MAMNTIHHKYFSHWKYVTHTEGHAIGAQHRSRLYTPEAGANRQLYNKLIKFPIVHFGLLLSAHKWETYVSYENVITRQITNRQNSTITIRIFSWPLIYPSLLRKNQHVLWCCITLLKFFELCEDTINMSKHNVCLISQLSF